MKKRKKQKQLTARMLSVIMTIAMVVSMLPTMAFAAETDGESSAAAAVEEQQPAADNDAAQDEAVDKVTDQVADEAENADAAADEDAAVNADEDNVSEAADNEEAAVKDEAAALEAEQNGEEQPAEDQTYTQSYESTDFSDKGISQMKYSVSTTDTKGSELTENSGSIDMAESEGKHIDEVWTRTELGSKWKNVIGMLQDSGVNVDSRSTYIFELNLKNSEDKDIVLDDSKTQVNVSASWSGYTHYDVYIYNEKENRIYKEENGTHDEQSFSGYYMASDNFVLPANCKAVYVAELTPAEKLEPGAYTLDADLTVLGKNNQILPGIQVYLSNTQVPPTSPQKDNAYLVVGEDGSLTLTLDEFNQVFAQLDIQSGRDVKVEELRYVDAETPTGKRINGITLKLDNYNGYYAFTNCKQYATPFQMEKDMQLDLIVDFSTAKKSYTRPGDGEAEYVRSFTDEKTGISAEIRTTEDFGTKMMEDGASLKISEITSGDEKYDDLKFRMDRLYMRNCYKLYSLDLLDKNGDEITTGGNMQIYISDLDVGKWMNPVVRQFNENDAPLIDCTLSDDGKISFRSQSLNDFTVVGKYTKGDKDMNYANYPAEYGNALPLSWNISESSDGSFSVTQYTITGNTTTYADELADDSFTQWGENEYCDGVYSTARSESENGETRYYAKLENYLVRERNAKIEVKLPADGAKSNFYFVMTDGEYTYVKQITDTVEHNGSIYFDIVNSYYKDITKNMVLDEGDFNRDWAQLMTKALSNGYDNAVPESGKPVGYILNSDKLYAGQPFPYVKKGNSVKYTGVAQSATMWMTNDSAVIKGDRTATDAGDYTFTAEPTENRTWLNGSNDAVSYNWTINKVTLYVEPVTQVIHEGEQPDLSLNVTGFVNNETPETAADYVAPVLKAPETLEAGQTYTLIAEGGSARNYDFSMYERKITVVSADTKIAKIPEAKTDVVATGEDVIGVPEGEGYTLSGDWKGSKEQTKYKAVATLSDGYIWSDGSTGNKNITWTLYKGVERPVIEKTRLLYTGKLVNLGTSNNELYTRANGYSIAYGEAVAAGNYTARFEPGFNCLWSDGTKDPVYIDWSIVKMADIPTAVTGLKENGTEQIGVPEGEGYTIVDNKATKAGDYKAVATLKDGYIWSDETSEPKTIEWSIAEASNSGNNGGGNGGSTGTTEKTEKAVANLYVPGELNKQLPGVTAYLTNPDNPVGTASSNVPDGWTFKSVAPTSPMNVNNAVLKTDKNGKKTLTVQVCNPVFTLQSIKGTSSNGGAKVIETKTEKGDYAGKSSRITEVTFEILKDADSYVFEDCVEYPTLLKTEWDVPLTLVINNVDKLPDTDGSKVDTGNGGGSGSGTVTTPTDQNGNAATGKFSDVPDNAYYKKAVDWAVEKNVTAGATATTFAPEKVCTRAQTVTFLWRAAGSPEPTSTVNPFTDVSSDAYYYKAVLWAVEKGITKGVTATTFAPEKTVTRGQVVTFQHRLAGSPAVEGADSFADVASDSYCSDAVKWAAKNGITSGKSATAFAPEEGCTRAQIVTFLYRQLGASAEK